MQQHALQAKQRDGDDAVIHCLERTARGHSEYQGEQNADEIGPKESLLDLHDALLVPRVTCNLIAHREQEKGQQQIVAGFVALHELRDNAAEQSQQDCKRHEAAQRRAMPEARCDERKHQARAQRRGDKQSLRRMVRLGSGFWRGPKTQSIDE